MKQYWRLTLMPSVIILISLRLIGAKSKNDEVMVKALDTVMEVLELQKLLRTS
jgi:hypothetical protein